MTTTPNALGVSDQLGSGGTGLSPEGGSGPSDGLPNLQALLRLLFGSIWQPYANAAALTASLAINRSDGQVALRLSDYTLWAWEAESVAAAGATVIVPTDVGGGAGRWVQFATAASAASLPGLGIQSGTGVLVNGVSAAIAATITANSRIVVTRKDANGSAAIGILGAATADRVVGAPGSFIVRSLSAAAAAVAGDESSFDYHIIG